MAPGWLVQFFDSRICTLLSGMSQVDRLIPPSALVVDEKSWISYPYMRTVITIPFFSRLKMEIESIHIDDNRGDTPNALNLPEDLLAIRKIDYMDLGSEKVQ